MIVRILTIPVKPEMLQDWLRYTADVGFPAMLRQPGCLGVWRLREVSAVSEYNIMSAWDCIESLQTFRQSRAMTELQRRARLVSEPLKGEVVFETVGDAPKSLTAVLQTTSPH